MSSFKKGGIIILSSPSGAGKTTLVKKISKNKKFTVSISHTTRSPRPNEKDGKDYYFVSKNNFKKLIKKKEFLEHAKVFDIDWQGTRQIRNKKLKYKLLTIFILPPSRSELLKRLIKREKKNMKTVKKRMKEFKKDLMKWKEYDYVVINDDLDLCYKKIMQFIKSKKYISFDKVYINNHVKKLIN